jgi:maleylpyruvate isomerase
MYASTAVRDHEIDFGATLSPIALRHLFDHSAVHLNVEWRDLPEDAWHSKVRTIQGREVPATETVWMRSREVWMHAVDLDNGASFRDIPVPVLERLLADITAAWKTRGTDAGLVVEVTDRGLALGDTTSGSPTVVSGPLAAVVEWAAGRGSSGVAAAGPGAGNADEGTVPAPPKWI